MRLSFDPMAGLSHSPLPLMPQTERPQTLLVFDSGLGGLTVFREIRALRPDARFIYVGDFGAFPYGRLSENQVIARVGAVLERQIARFAPDCVVIACNTASTLVLPSLRARFAMPFVGTVPAIKPACAASHSKLISVLATPGTVARDYTRALINEYAGACDVTLVGATGLAALAERHMRGEAVDDAAILAEIAPCFVTREGRRTDAIALACTHYPLLLDAFKRLAPWDVAWIDPAAAIARRVVQLAGPVRADSRVLPSLAVFTKAGDDALLPSVLESFGLPQVEIDSMPLEADSAAH